MSNLPAADLSSLASDINKHHSQAICQAKSALDHARQAGELLTQAKSLVPHGEWLTWLEANCQVSARQAQRYMRVATNWDAITKNDAASYLTIDAAIAASNEKPGQTLARLLDAGYQSEHLNDVDEHLAGLHEQWLQRSQALNDRFNGADDIASLSQLIKDALQLQNEVATCNLTLRCKIGGMLNDIRDLFRGLGGKDAIANVAVLWGWSEQSVAELWMLTAEPLDGGGT